MRWTVAAAPLVRLAAAVLAPFYGVVARTGIGTNSCLRRGFLPVPIHYYQPIFDAAVVPERTWKRKHPLPGIEFEEADQLVLLAALAKFGGECDWPEHDAGYHWGNPSFGYTSACLLHSVIRHLRPARIVEVGAGWSTLVSAEAVELNGFGVVLSIDPYPPSHVQGVEVIRKEVQTVDPDVFTSLGENDLLFIDSSHVSRTGGDVNFLYLDILANLQPGVMAHIHDIYLPYEYPREYSAREKSRFFWNEQYLLQAFLALNPSFRVELSGYMLFTDHPEEFSAAFPGFDPVKHREPTSFYVRRV